MVKFIYCLDELKEERTYWRKSKVTSSNDSIQQ